MAKGEGKTVRIAISLIAVCALTACAAPQTRVEIQRVNVPVPVECREREPDRPTMPTEALVPGVAPYRLLQSALAEIDRREGYEVRLRAALRACMEPVVQQTPK